MAASEAQKRATQRYKERNREQVREKNREYKRTAGRDVQNAASARWREKNPDKVEVYAREYQQKKEAKPKPDRKAEFTALVGENPDFSKLDSRQRTIITLYYGLEEEEPQSDPKIGELFGCSRQNINKERKRALQLLIP